MGMTINEHIAQLKKLKSFHNGSYGASINYALDIIIKYQKIEEIIKSWKDGTIEEKDSIYAFHKIMEVIENGNDA